MLFLVFELGEQRYALEASQVSEVLPLVHVRPVPHAPAGVVGVFDLRGRPIPVIDVSVLMLRRPAERRLSTRLIIVQHCGGRAAMQPVALMAEKATRTIRREPSAFLDSGIASEGGRSGTAMAIDGDRFVQRVSLSELLPDAVQRALFGTTDQPWASPTSSVC